MLPTLLGIIYKGPVQASSTPQTNTKHSGAATFDESVSPDWASGGAGVGLPCYTARSAIQVLYEYCRVSRRLTLVVLGAWN